MRGGYPPGGVSIKTKASFLLNDAFDTGITWKVIELALLTLEQQ